MKVATCSRFAILDQHPMHLRTKSHPISLVVSTVLQRSSLVCSTTLPSIFGQLDALSTKCTLVRFYLRAAPTTRCYDQSWIAEVNSRLKCSSAPSWHTSTSTRWPTLDRWSKRSLLERYGVYFRFFYRYSGQCLVAAVHPLQHPTFPVRASSRPQYRMSILRHTIIDTKYLLTSYLTLGHHQDPYIR
jgi:hypothetical protein